MSLTAISSLESESSTYIMSRKKESNVFGLRIFHHEKKIFHQLDVHHV